MRMTKLVAVLLLTPLFAACAKGPSESEVEGLIAAQYQQANSAMNSAMNSASAQDQEMAKAIGNMMAGMMPKLEGVDDVNCDSIEGENTYMCTANIKQTVGGNSSDQKASFKVYKVNDEWVLGN
jgi:hypothetical protein